MQVSTKARSLRLVGATLMFSGAALVIGPRMAGALDLHVSLPGALLLVIAGLALIAVGATSLRYGKQLITKSADALLSEDNRPPVLYLRAFSADDVLAQPIGTMASPAKTSQEEDLVEALRDFGPVIAIGRPGEPLPTLGAARKYVDDDIWKSQIGSWLENATMVVLVAGSTPGLLWEVEQVVRHSAPRNVLIIVTASRETYASYVRLTARLFPEPLPPVDLVFRNKRFLCRLTGIQVQGIIVFDHDWNPTFAPFHFDLIFWRYWRSGDMGALTRSFRGIFRECGVGSTNSLSRAQ